MGSARGSRSTRRSGASGGDPCRVPRPGRRRRAIQARAATRSTSAPARALARHDERDPAAQRDLRAAVRRLQPAGDRAGAGREGRAGRLRRRRRPRRADQPAGAGRRPADPLRAGALPGVGAAVPARGLHPRRADLRLLRQLGHEHRPRRPAQPRAARTPGTTSSPPAGGATTPRPTGRWPRWAGRCRTPRARRAAPPGGCSAPGRSTRAGGSGSAVPESVVAHDVTGDRRGRCGRWASPSTRSSTSPTSAARPARPPGCTGFWDGYFAFRAAPLGAGRARGGDGDLLQLRAGVRRPAGAGGLGAVTPAAGAGGAAGRRRRRRPPAARRRLAGVGGGGRGGRPGRARRPRRSTPAGRPLAAANAGLPWPDEPHLGCGRRSPRCASTAATGTTPPCCSGRSAAWPRTCSRPRPAGSTGSG